MFRDYLPGAAHSPASQTPDPSETPLSAPASATPTASWPPLYHVDREALTTLHPEDFLASRVFR